MTPKEKAKEIFDNIVNEGKSTDYFYSDDFYKWAKEMAIQKAKDYSNRYGEESTYEFWEEVKAELEKL